MVHRYDTLLHLAKERRQRLDEAKARFGQSSQINELQHWINDKVYKILSISMKYESGKNYSILLYNLALLCDF